MPCHALKLLLTIDLHADGVFVDSYKGFDIQSVGPNQLHCFFVIEHAFEYSASKAFTRKLRECHGLTEKSWRTVIDPADQLYVELDQLHSRKEDEKVCCHFEHQTQLVRLLLLIVS